MPPRKAAPALGPRRSCWRASSSPGSALPIAAARASDGVEFGHGNHPRANAQSLCPGSLLLLLLLWASRLERGEGRETRFPGCVRQPQLCSDPAFPFKLVRAGAAGVSAREEPSRIPELNCGSARLELRSAGLRKAWSKQQTSCFKNSSAEVGLIPGRACGALLGSSFPVGCGRAVQPPSLVMGSEITVTLPSGFCTPAQGLARVQPC